MGRDGCRGKGPGSTGAARDGCVVVSHGSALWLWRRGWRPVRRLSCGEAAGLLDRPPSRRAADRAKALASYPDNRPLHVLVGSDALRRHLSGVAAHMVPAAVDASTVPLVEVEGPCGGDWVVAVAPEASWAQTARRMGAARSREVAWELTGSYRVDPDAPFGLASRDPLASVGLCRDASALLAGGTLPRRAARALQGVLDGAASPAEGRVACLMVLPRSRGGYGLPAPLLNVGLELEDDERLLVDAPRVRPDFLWPDAGVVLEYDSDAAHFGADAPVRARRDALRRNFYEGRGWRHVSLTRDRLADPAACDRTMALVEDALAVRRPGPSAATLAARGRLRRELFGFRG